MPPPSLSDIGSEGQPLGAPRPPTGPPSTALPPISSPATAAPSATVLPGGAPVPPPRAATVPSRGQPPASQPPGTQAPATQPPGGDVANEITGELSIFRDEEPNAAGATAAGAITEADRAEVLPPSQRAGRRIRDTPPPPISPARALAGAAIAVAGVALGIGAVLLLTDDPDDGTVTPPAAASARASAPAVARTAAPSAAAPSAAAPSAAAPSAAAPSAAAPPAPPVPVTRPPLTVLNNSKIKGLADKNATQFAKDGWTIAQVGNFTGRVASSTVYFAPGQEAAAQELATAYAIPRVLPRFNGLPGSGLTVVLTKDAA